MKGQAGPTLPGLVRKAVEFGAADGLVEVGWKDGDEQGDKQVGGCSRADQQADSAQDFHCAAEQDTGFGRQGRGHNRLPGSSIGEMKLPGACEHEGQSHSKNPNHHRGL